MQLLAMQQTLAELYKYALIDMEHIVLYTRTPTHTHGVSVSFTTSAE